MKATHNGTCQACGRQQAAVPNRHTGINEKLAKHGYRVIWNQFNGECVGSGEPPIEHDTRLARGTIASLTAQANDLEALTASDITKVEVATDRRVNYRTVYESVTFDEFSARARAGKWAATIARIKSGDSSYTTEAQVALWIKDEWDGEVKSILRRHKNTAKMMRDHVAMLEKLIATRHGQPLYVRGA